MKKWLSTMLALSLLALAVAVPFGKPASAAVTTLNPVADTDTQSDSAAGTNIILNASQWNHIFAKFSLTGLSGVTNAKVRLYHSEHVTNHNLIVHHASTENWSEGGSKPTLGSQIASKAVSAVGYVEFDVTAAVQGKLSGGQTSATFGFSTNIGTWERYLSRQSASNKPELIVTTGTGSDTQAPTAPSNLISTGKTDTTVSLSWSASTDNVGVTGYDVYRGSTLAGSASGTSYTATGLSPSTTYSFTVRARDAAGNVSPASGALSVTTNAASAAGKMKMGTNFWFMASWSGETPFKSNVDWANAYSRGDDVWNPAFIAELAPYANLRFMDWGGTNNSKVQTWSQRRLPTDPVNADIGYIGPDTPLRPGLAYEWMIDLGNRTNKDIWICLPHMADDNYANQLAQLVKAKLKPSLKVYVEYSNETWNGGFTQFQYTIDQGVAMNLPGSNQWYKGGAYSVYKSVRIWNEFAKVFGSEMSTRVVRVGAFSGNYDIFDQGYNSIVNSSTYNPTGQKADMFAIAPYVGSHLDGASSTIQTQFRQDIDKVFNDRVVPAVNIAKKYNVKLGCYEGGQHLLTNANVWSGNQKIYDEYMYMFDKFASSFVLFDHYAHAGSWSSGGAWGAKAFTGQSEADAPKYRAIKAWAAANP